MALGRTSHLTVGKKKFAQVAKAKGGEPQLLRRPVVGPRVWWLSWWVKSQEMPGISFALGVTKVSPGFKWQGRWKQV